MATLRLLKSYFVAMPSLQNTTIEVCENDPSGNVRKLLPIMAGLSEHKLLRMRILREMSAILGGTTIARRASTMIITRTMTLKMIATSGGGQLTE